MNKRIKKFLPYSRQAISARDVNAVKKILSEDYITQGPRISMFERNFADYVGAKYAVACATGTAALHLSLLALDINKNHNLLTSPITFLSSANCIQFLGGDTFFSDIDSETICLSPYELEKMLKLKKIDIVVAVHMAGHSCEMKKIFKLKKKYNFFLIEDACHALGGEYNNFKIGSSRYSDLSTFSFHPVKPITTAEGGMITTNNKHLYEKLLIYRTHGMHKNINEFKNKHLAFDGNGNVNSWYYEMNILGYNYRITDIQCVLGINQLRKIDNFLSKKEKLAEFYDKSLMNNKYISLPKRKKNIKHGHHLYTLRVNFEKIGKSRNRVMRELRDQNIGTQVLYIPLHLQPYYSEKYKLKMGDYPEAEKYYRECLSIPFFPKISKSEAKLIVKVLNEVIS